MTKLIKYELVKLFSHKNVKYIFILLFLVSMLFVYLESINYDQSSKYHSIYQSIKTEIQDKDLKDKNDYLNEQLNFIDTVLDYELSQNSEIFIYEGIKKFDSSFIQKYEQYVTTEEYKDIYVYADVYKEMHDYYDAIMNYDSYIDNIQKNGDNYKNGFMWSQADDVKKYDIVNAVETYTQLKGIDVIETNTLTIDIYNHLISPYFILLIASIFVALSVFQEDENSEIGQLQLISLQGKYKTAIAKLIIVLVVSALLSILFNVGSLLLLSMIYGLIDGGIAMQSISTLYESPYRLSVNEYLINMIMLKTFFLMMIVSIFCGIHKVFKKGIISILTIILLFAISGILFMTINETQTIGLLKYLNLYAFLCSNHFFAKYMNGLAYYHLNITSVSSLIAIVLLIIFIIIYFISYTRNRQFQFKIFNIFKKLHISISSTNLFIQEFFKNLWINKTIVFIVLLMLVQGYYLFNAYLNVPSFVVENEYMVAESIQQYGGTLSDEEKASIELKNSQYTEEKMNLDNEYEKLLRNEIEQDVYNANVEDYLSKNKERLIFYQLYDRYTNSNEYLTYSNGYRFILSLNTYNRELRCAVLLILSMIFLTYSMINSDEQKDENTLYLITKKGRKKRLFKRIKIVLLVGCGLVLIYSLSELFVFKQIYPMNDWNAPISSILSYEDNIVLSFPFTDTMPIWQYYVAFILIRLFSLLTCGFITMLISYVCKNKIQAFIVAIAVFILPLLVYQGGLDFILSVSLFDMVMSNMFIQSQIVFIKLISYMIIDVLIVYFLYKKVKE